MRIIWTPVAKESYNEIEAFLMIRWNLEITQDFISAVSQTMRIVKENPYCFQKWEHDNSYLKGFVNSKVSFYYKVKSQEIVVYLFWNNVQNPESLEEMLK